MKEIEEFIKDAARQRGIDPDIAIKVAKSEGGVDEYAKRGTFPTGSSWWSFQLHYGGQGYEHFGTVAGQGNGFTVLTGWQPGDPKAWRDSTRYALNRAKASGWSAWYGAAAVGVGRWDGIDRNHPWDAAAERWDFETAPASRPGRVSYDREHPVHRQEETFDCSQESLEWALWSLGRQPSDDWLEGTMISEGVMSADLGLLDASGARLAAFVDKHYGEYGFLANNEPSISWEWVRGEGAANADGSGHAYPVLIGGRTWNHWSPIRDFDPARDVLLLANPAEGWGGVGQTMTRQQFAALGPFSAVRIWHGDLLGLASEPVEDPPPPLTAGQIRARLLEIVAQIPEGTP